MTHLSIASNDWENPSFLPVTEWPVRFRLQSYFNWISMNRLRCVDIATLSQDWSSRMYTICLSFSRVTRTLASRIPTLVTHGIVNLWSFKYSRFPSREISSGNGAFFSLIRRFTLSWPAFLPNDFFLGLHPLPFIFVKEKEKRSVVNPFRTAPHIYYSVCNKAHGYCHSFKMPYSIGVGHCMAMPCLFWWWKLDYGLWRRPWALRLI